MSSTRRAVSYTMLAAMTHVICIQVPEVLITKKARMKRGYPLRYLLLDCFLYCYIIAILVTLFLRLTYQKFAKLLTSHCDYFIIIFLLLFI